MNTMLDIETLGTEPGCVIVSIGAVKFNEDTIGNTFHRTIDIESCTDAGLTIDGDTLQWWLKQDAKEELTGSDDLEEVLNAFAMFCEGDVWANAPTFDCRILGAAYSALGMETPWEYYDERCYRTLKDIVTVPIEQNGTKHNALDDAISQAKTAQRALRKL